MVLRAARWRGVQKTCWQGRCTVGALAALNAAHVELVGELVDHDVLAFRCQFAGVGDVLPAQHHRAAVHGFAGQHLAVAVHHARTVGDFALGHGGTGLHHDADKVAVPVEHLHRVARETARGQAHVQQRQAGLCRDAQCHGVGDVQAMGSMEFFLLQEMPAQAAQTFPLR
jgi:hypothetical protein